MKKMSSELEFWLVDDNEIDRVVNGRLVEAAMRASVRKFKDGPSFLEALMADFPLARKAIRIATFRIAFCRAMVAIADASRSGRSASARAAAAIARDNLPGCYAKRMREAAKSMWVGVLRQLARAWPLARVGRALADGRREPRPPPGARRAH